MIYYDLDGEQIDLERWTQLTSTDRAVGRYERGDTLVSTIWLGIDTTHDSGPPEIFETMVFQNRSAVFVRRYPSHRDALTGHRDTIAQFCPTAPNRRMGMPPLPAEPTNETSGT